MGTKGAGEAWKRSLESSSCWLAGRGELLQLSLLGEGFVQCDLAPAGSYLFAELRMIAALVSGGGNSNCVLCPRMER